MAIWAGFLGLIFGSFGTAIAYRIPRGEPIATGRSRCPSCGQQIRWFENVPVFGYIALRGRCGRCGARISPRYPLTELVTAVLFALAVWRFGITLEAAIYAFFFWILVVLVVIDLEHKLLPNRIVYPLLIAGWVALGIDAFLGGGAGDLLNALWGSLIFGGFLFTIAFIAPGGMGGGDWKLAFSLGAFLGYAGGIGFVLVGMFLSFMLGGLVGVVLLLRGGGRKTAVPFGPFLAAGTVLGILFGRAILDWYL